MATKGKAERDNRSTQLNQTSDAYWKSRGLPQRPADWKSPTLKNAVPAQKVEAAKKP